MKEDKNAESDIENSGGEDKGHYAPGMISNGMLYISGQLSIDPGHEKSAGRRRERTYGAGASTTWSGCLRQLDARKMMWSSVVSIHRM